MRRRVSAASLVWVALASVPAAAADLAGQSPLGAVFAERPARVVVRTEDAPRSSVFPIPIKVPGYYGGWDTTYRNYYGTSPVTIFTRLPYACKWHGLC